APSGVQAKTASTRVMWAVSAGNLSTTQPGSVSSTTEGGPAKGRSLISGEVASKETEPAPEKESIQPTDSGKESEPAATSFSWATPILRETLIALEPTIPKSSGGEEWLAETAKKLRSALLAYGLQAKLLDQRLTPNAALVRFQGSDRLKVNDVDTRRSQLLTTHELRVIRVA